MGSDFLRFQQDPSLGNALSSIVSDIGAAPGKALSNTHMVEEILKAREERARATEKWNAGQEAFKAFPDTLQKTVEPSLRDVQFQPQGPVNPADVGDTAQIGDTTVLPSYTTQEKFIDPRQQAQLDAYNRLATAAYRQQTMLGKSDEYGPLIASATVGGAGVPADVNERNRLNFLATHKFMTDAEKSTATPHTFDVMDKDGGWTGRSVTSNNNRTEIATGRPLMGPGGILQPGESLVVASPQSNTQGLNKERAIQRLSIIANNLRGAVPTPEQAATIDQLVTTAYQPERTVESGAGGNQTIKYVQKTPIPPWVVKMLPAGAVGGDVAAAAPGSAAAVVAPGSAATTQQPIDYNADRVVGQLPGSAVELRKEYAEQPEIKNYVTAATTWNAAVQSAYTGNKAADLDIVYGFVKLLDSLTGVRDAEVKMVGQVGSWPEQLQTMLGQASGKGLDARTRSNIIETMQRHMIGIQQAAEMKQKFYTQAATNAQLAPKAVIPDLVPMVPFDRARAMAVQNQPDAAAVASGPGAGRRLAAPPPAAPSTVPPQVIERGKNAFGL